MDIFIWIIYTLIISGMLSFASFFWGVEDTQQRALDHKYMCGFPKHKGILICYKLIEDGKVTINGQEIKE